MMRLTKSIMLLFMMSVGSLQGITQVTINFNTPVYGQSLEGLSFVQLFNSSNEAVLAAVTIRVSETTAGNVLTGKLTAVPLKRGSNILDRAAFSRGRFSFANNYYGQTISQTGRFPEGEYEYCFEVEITDSKTPWTAPFFENCFVQQLQPMTPLLLVNPADEDISCNNRPSFIWQLPAPLPAEARCRIIVSELKDKQDIAEAINYNIPVINQGNIFGNQVMYPAAAPSLQEGKSYAWQVTVYTGKSILKKSEIWVYKVKCETEPKDFATDSYRELKEKDDAFYITDKMLRFSFNNPYGPGLLSYSISSLATPDVNIKGLPDLKLLPGLNKYDIDLSDNKAFKKGQEYVLKLRLVNRQELTLRFLYKAE